MNKEVRITVRLTPEQYESIRARADTAQLSPSAYIRAAVSVPPRSARWQSICPRKRL